MITNETIKLIECPRDAMQGWPTFIPTEKKVQYINSLLQVGFHTLDFGSFVSPKAIPQMKDTKAVLKKLDISGTATKLLAIVANVRGAEEAVLFDEISYLGYPFSVSPTFQKLNTNSTIEESLITVERIQALCGQHNKTLVVYMSMGFGNPYGDVYNEAVLMQWTTEIMKRGISVISLADTVGLAAPDQISKALKALIPHYPDIEFGVHLHASAQMWQEKLEAAYTSGCTRFDGAIKGIGGCPMANNPLVGNMNTEWMIDYFKQRQALPYLDFDALRNSINIADQIFISE